MKIARRIWFVFAGVIASTAACTSTTRPARDSETGRPHDATRETHYQYDPLRGDESFGGPGTDTLGHRPPPAGPALRLEPTKEEPER